MRKNLIILQEGYKDCGAASLLSIIRYYGGDISLERLIEMTKTGKEGTNFYNLSMAASEVGLMAKSSKVSDILKLKEIREPYIVQLNNKNYTHFAVVYKMNEDTVLMMDPAKGKTVIDTFDFSSTWTGYIMLFEKIKSLTYSPSNSKLSKVIISSLLQNKSIIIFLIILSIIITSLSMITSFYSQIVFDKVLNTELNNLVLVTIFFSVLFMLKGITGFIRNYLIIFLNQKLDISIIISTFSNIILLPFNYYKTKTTSEVLSRITDLSHVKTFISKLVITVFLDVIIFIVSSITIYLINKKIVIILVIMITIYAFLALIFSPILKKINIRMQESREKLNTRIIESVSSFETIKGLNIEDSTILNFEKDYSKFLFNSYYSDKVNNIINLLKELIYDLGILILNYISFKLIMKSNMTIGNYITISFLSNYLLSPVSNFISLVNDYHYLKSSIKRANNLLEVDEEDFDAEKLTVSGNIKIKSLSYTFNNKYYPLQDISLDIKDKERIMLIGGSGTGKSTLLKLLYKYYIPDRDKIFINNYDINDYTLSDIRKNIIYIAQNEMLYTASIRDNIILSRNVSEEEFLNVCKLTYVDEIIKDNILGYDYMIEENGTNISGGQRQRIILARSMLKGAKIVMIDEGLNQIDIKLERIILENLFYLFPNKTFIIVSHRMDNIDLYDRVLKITNNRVELIRGGTKS